MGFNSELTARERVRRYFFDLPLSITLIIVLFIPLALLSAIIWLDSPGSPIYGQPRTGRKGKEFQIYKARTMFVGSSKEVVLDDATDERVTRVGRIIRRLRIDELFQLINVMKGDMSIFGPRPECVFIHHDHVQLTPEYPMRNKRLPGILGYAQLFGRESFLSRKHETKLALDLYYLDRQSLWGDFKIFFKTIEVLATGRKLSISEHPLWHHLYAPPVHAQAAE